ncbi:MAG TPA: DNA repair protein RecO [Bdellovibrionota bacterium]|nr:DNA repair protein RecO [Bdellovibrionota bacterium]
MSRPLESMEAVIVRQVPYGEADLIVGLMTDLRGKLSVFASGARKSVKRFGGGLDLFSYVRADLRPPRAAHEHLWRLEKIELIDPHFSVRSNLRAFATASYLAECIWSLGGEGDPQHRLFVWWRETLAAMERDPAASDRAVQLDLELLKLCGYSPRWNVCIECGRPPQGNPLFFSFEQGGISCQSCRKRGEGRWLDSATVRHLYSGESMEHGEEDSIRRTLDAFVTHTLGREPKSQRFREEILRERG